VTDDRGHEWEVIGHPAVYNQGKQHQVRVQKAGNPSTKSINLYPAHERVMVKPRGQGGGAAPRQGGGAAPRPTRTELLVRDSDGKPVYRLTLPCDPVADPAYLKASWRASRSASSRASGRGTRRWST
jgi:hypothetical protein